MANAIYPKFKQSQIDGNAINLTTVNLKLILVDTGAYTYSASHQYLSDVAAGARIATSGNLASKTVINGTLDFADVVFSAVSGASVEAVILYHDSGVEATSRLICYKDTGETGLPLTPNGADVNFTVDAAGFLTF